MYNSYILLMYIEQCCFLFFVLFNVSRTLRKIYLENLDCIRYYFVPRECEIFLLKVSNRVSFPLCEAKL